MTDPNVFMVAELKEKLRARGLSATGIKNELITRLMETDPSGEWMAERDDCRANSDANVEHECGREKELRRRELDFYRREKKLAERELELARREIAMLRAMRRGDPRRIAVDRADEMEAAACGDIGVSGIPRTPMRMNITKIADLLSEFDGANNNFDTWKKQLRFLRVTYRLEHSNKHFDHVKVLIGMRLKKRALE